MPFIKQEHKMLLLIKGFELLKPNHTGAMRLKNGRTINYSVIRVENDKLVHYTGKGLREIWSPRLTGLDKENAEKLKKTEEEGGEEKLIASEHIAVTNLTDIEKILY